MPTPTCPSDCSSALAVTSFSKCNPDINLSEVRRLFIAKATAAAFTDWKLATEWTARISATDIIDDDTIRALSGIGDVPAGTPVNKEISNGRTILLYKDRVLNFTIDDVSPENYEFMRTLECGGLYKMWFETEGGYLYGGNNGILVRILADDVLNRGRDEIETIAMQALWRNKFAPDRALSPIYDSDYAVAI